MAGRTFALSAFVALVQAKALITNHCSEDIYIWSIPHVGSSYAENLCIKSGGRYEEPWRYGTDSNPGIAIKISSQPNGIYDDGDEIDFSYTVEKSNSSKVWTDLSCVRGQTFDGRITFFGCNGQATSSLPEIDTQACDGRQNLELVFCGTERSSPEMDTAPLDTINECCGYQPAYHEPMLECSNCTMTCCTESCDEASSSSDSDSDCGSSSDSESDGCTYAHHHHHKCPVPSSGQYYSVPQATSNGYSTPYGQPPSTYNPPPKYPAGGYSTFVTTLFYPAPQPTQVVYSPPGYAPPASTQTVSSQYLPPAYTNKAHGPRKPASEESSLPKQVVGNRSASEQTNKHHHQPGPMPAHYPSPQPTWSASYYPHPGQAPPKPHYAGSYPAAGKPYASPIYGADGQWHYPPGYHNGDSAYPPGHHNGGSHYSPPGPPNYAPHHPYYTPPKYTTNPYSVPTNSPYSKPKPQPKPYPAPHEPTEIYHQPTAVPTYAPGACKGKPCCPKTCCEKKHAKSQCYAKVVYPMRRATTLGGYNGTIVQLKQRNIIPLIPAPRAATKTQTSATKATEKPTTPSPLCDLFLQNFPQFMTCDEQALEVYAREIYPHLCEPEYQAALDGLVDGTDCNEVKADLKEAFPGVDKALQSPATNGTHNGTPE